ncbi:3-hydroxyacyl-CoA dehydrogenase [Bacillus sp. FJAT-44742]|uniref:3-hydroxyacyl-CoA dehydrogenase n=1 Tax=Bacillus sp. FJAT-44742 TaxID=2014005 RepID=UPI000C246213|nr:3-hydroxyacyl-CoA dehydrogenase [Bacillus sp. FJAT-44742]
MNINDATVLVTGGASGLGEATVRRLVSQGANAVIIDHNEERGKHLAEELGKRVLFYKGDVTSEKEITEGLDEAEKTFGSLHILVNCAGIGVAEKVLSRKGAHSFDLFSKVIQINLIGTFNMIRLVSERMKENKEDSQGERGVIINTASVAAFEGQIGQAAYSASKGGVASMTLPVARELARYGIRVMTIAPGLFETPMFESLPDDAKEALGKMTPFPKRLGQPLEYAMLANQIIENPMLNGETIRLDGAIRMQPK